MIGLDAFVRELWLGMPGHDEDIGLCWACGHCPYTNTGRMCTKCGTVREDGMIVGGRAIARFRVTGAPAFPLERI